MKNAVFILEKPEMENPPNSSSEPELAIESIGGVGRHKHYSRFYRDGGVFDYIGDTTLFKLAKARLKDKSLPREMRAWCCG